MNTEYTDIPSSENLDDSRVSLPQPDAENITVLTKALPNEPILPWHHFDSPWLTMEAAAIGEEAAEAVQSNGLSAAESSAEVAQLSLFEQSPDAVADGDAEAAPPVTDPAMANQSSPAPSATADEAAAPPLAKNASPTLEAAASEPAASPADSPEP
ncbi:MAG: hypothetical protein ACFB8W_22965 [Elainellaceae cyanobacterium]